MTGQPPLKRLLRILKPDIREIRDIYLFAIIAGILSLGLPLGIQAIINFIQAGRVSASWFVLVGLVLSAITLNGLLNVAQMRLTENLQQKLFVRSSFEFASRIPGIQLKEWVQRYAPEWTNRFFETITIQKGLSKLLIDISAASLQILFGLLLLSFYHSFFIVFGLLLILVIGLLYRFTSKKGLETSLEESKYKFKVANWIEEIARTRYTFKFFSSYDIVLKKTDAQVSSYLAAREKHFKVLVAQYYSLIAFKVLITLVLLSIGALLVLNQQLNIGQFVAAEIIIVLVLNSVEKLIVSLEQVYDVLTAVEKIGELTELSLDSTTGHVLDNSAGIALQMEGLSYKSPWQKQRSFSDLHFEANAGSWTRIHSQDPHNTRLFFYLAAGFITPNSGSIFVNQLPMAHYNLKSYQHQLATCMASDQLIYGSVLENMVLGREALTLERVIDLASAIGLHDIILQWPEAYQTQLNPEALTLSEEVNALIIICRALLSNRTLLIWDELAKPVSEEKALLIGGYLKAHFSGTILMSTRHESLQQFVTHQFVLSSC
jgi:ABC-type bacteriocin/lantibiotic exporter with double-glycine peptidase domain